MQRGPSGESDDGRLWLERDRHPGLRHSRSPPPSRDRVLERAGSADCFPCRVTCGGGPVAVRTVEKQGGWLNFHKVPAADGHGRELQLWVVGDGNGFQVLRFTNAFKARHKDLMTESVGSE